MLGPLSERARRARSATLTAAGAPWALGLAGVVALLAACDCGGTGADAGCPEAGPGADAAGDGLDGGMAGTDACPPVSCTVGIECGVGMACIDGACADPGGTGCPSETGTWVGAPVAPLLTGPTLARFDDAGALHLFYNVYWAGGFYYARVANGETTVQTLATPCTEWPIAMDVSVPGEVLLASIGMDCSGGADELSVWTVTATTASRVVMPTPSPVLYDSINYHWGGFARTPLGDFLAIDTTGDSSYELCYFVNLGSGWQEEVFSPRSATTVDVAPLPDGTVAVLESFFELRLATWTQGSLVVNYTTVSDEVWGDGPRWLDPTPGAERVVLDDLGSLGGPSTPGLTYAHRDSGVWTRELVPITRPSWWNPPGFTNWNHLPLASRETDAGEVVLGFETDIDPALAPMYASNLAAVLIAQRATSGTWRTDVIYNGAPHGWGPTGIALGADACSRLTVSFETLDDTMNPTEGMVWVYERH